MTNGNPEDMVIDQENVEAFQKKIEKCLSKMEKEVLALTLQGLDYHQVAQILSLIHIFVGVLAEDIFIDQVVEIVNKCELEGNSYAMLVDQNDGLMVHPLSLIHIFRVLRYKFTTDSKVEDF